MLALVFGAAALAGGAVGPVREPASVAATPADAMGMDTGHGEGAVRDPQAVRGLAVSEGGLSLELARTSARPGQAFELAFRIVGRDGRTVRDFDVEHTKRMHFIVVRRDMTGFQHLHPTERADGTWTVPVTLPDPAPSACSPISPSTTSRTRWPTTSPSTGPSVRATARAREERGRGRPARPPERGRRHAGEESQLAFDVTRNGRPVAVRTTSAPRGISWPCARATSGSCTCTPTRTA